MARSTVPTQRRRFLAGVGSSLLAESGRVWAAESPAIEAMAAEAAKEGRLSWISGVLDKSLCEAVARAFTARFPAVTVSLTRVASQPAFQQLIQDMRSGANTCDVFSTTDAGQMSYLASKQLLLPYVAESASALNPALRALQASGYQQVTSLSQVALLYNTDRVADADAPRDWPDLTAARWKRRLTFGSPDDSGLVGVWAVAMAQRYGWAYFERLNELEPLIGHSIRDATAVIGSGRRLVGVGNPASALRSAAEGAPLAVVYPSSGTVSVPSSSAIISRTRHPNAAKLFLQFLASEEYSRLLAAGFEQPLHPGVQPPAGAPSLAEMVTIMPQLADIEERLPIVKQQWLDTFTR